MRYSTFGENLADNRDGVTLAVNLNWQTTNDEPVRGTFPREEGLVDEKGIEPSTSALRTPRSPN